MPKETDIVVVQRLACVCRCPECRESIILDYEDFIIEYGSPSEWSGKKITCPHCDADMLIRNVITD